MGAIRRPKINLRNKILILMAVTAVAPISIAAYLAIDNVAVAHKTDVARMEDAAVSQKEAEITSYIRNAIFSTVNISVPDNSTNSKAVASNAMRPVFAQLLSASKGAVIELSAISLDGREVLRIDSNAPNGVPDSALRDLNRDAVFLSAKKLGSFMGPVVLAAQGPVASVASVVKDQAGNPLLVAMSRVKLFGLRDILQNEALGKTGYVYLVDGGGRVIGGGAAGPEYQSDASHIGIVPSVLQGRTFSGAEGQRRYKSSSDVEVVAAGKFLPEYGWGLVAEWPAGEADAIVGQLSYRSAAASFIIFLIIALASILLSIFIVKPLRELQKGAMRVAKGKLDEPVNIDTGDELEEVGEEFNKMIAGLKQLQELKDEFVFVAAHELRTPVAAMKGYLELIRDGATGPIADQTRGFIDRVINSNQRLIQLVNDLLEVSRSEGGKLTIKVVPIDVVRPVKEVLSELQSLADKANVQMAYAPQENLPKALADADRLKEVLVNLVGNSIKYMGPIPTRPGEAGGERRVTISHELGASGLITHVKDTGLGMSKQAQEKLFQKFYRIQTEQTREITGTGLGLFIVKEIIEKMGGKIWVESEGGKGSVFSFSLPLASPP